MTVVMQRFMEAHRDLANGVAVSRRVDLNRTKMRHPAILVRFSLGEIFKIVFAQSEGTSGCEERPL